MEKQIRNVWIIVGAIVLLSAGVIGYGVYRAYSFFSQMGFVREMPDEIKEARILQGKDFLLRTEMFKMKDQSFLETIGEIENTKDEREAQKLVQSRTARKNSSFSDITIVGDEIVVAANFGAFFFNLKGKLKREISFEPSEEKIKIGKYEQTYDERNFGNVKIAELEKKVLGFFSCDSMLGFTVFDKNGKRIWAFGKDKIELSILLENKNQNIKSVMGSTVGDLDSDGFAEYIVALQNDGIRAFNRNGIEQWYQPEKFPSSSLQIADMDGDGKNELLEIGAKEKKIRDAHGQIIREIKGGGAMPAVLFYENRNKKKTLIFCDIYESRLKCVDENENMVLKGDAPLSSIPKKNPKKVSVPGHPELTFMDDHASAAFPKAVWVTFGKDQPKYLAVVHSFIGLPRSHFYLYDVQGNLAYHELLPEDAKTIAAIPAANENQGIIIGGRSTIWKYTLNMR